MKFSSFTAALILMLTAGSLFSQAAAKPPAAPDSSEQVTGRSIRMASEPARYIDFFRKRSRENIGRLKTLTDTYEADVPGSRSDFTAIQEDYRKGLHSYYLNETGTSLTHLEKAFNHSNALLSKYSDFFKTSSLEILREAAGTVTEKDLALVYDPSGAKPGTNDTILRAQFRIRMAYQQMLLAEDARNRQMFDQSVDHYRLARLHGISVMMDLEDDAAKRKAIGEKYKKDLAFGAQSSQVDSGISPPQ